MPSPHRISRAIWSLSWESFERNKKHRLWRNTCNWALAWGCAGYFLLHGAFTTAQTQGFSSLFYFRWRFQLSLRDYVKINLITFGSPRIGNINLQKAMRVKAKSIGRFVTPHDPVPSSPPNEKGMRLVLPKSCGIFISASWKDSGCSWYVLASLMKLVTPKDYHHIADPIQVPLTEGIVCYNSL